MCLIYCKKSTESFFEKHKDDEFVSIYKVLEVCNGNVMTPYQGVFIPSGYELIPFPESVEFNPNEDETELGAGFIHAYLDEYEAKETAKLYSNSTVYRFIVHCRVPLKDVVAVSSYGQIVLRKLKFPEFTAPTLSESRKLLW